MLKQQKEKNMSGIGHKRKSTPKPGKNNKAENKTRTVTALNLFNFTEDQQRYYISKLKSVGLSFVNAIVILTADDYFAEDDIDPLATETSRTYASKIRRHTFENLVSFHALFEHNFTDAQESHQTLNLNDVHRNLA